MTYNSAEHLPQLLASLRGIPAEVQLEVLVVDNASSDGTAQIAENDPHVIHVPTGANLGYAGAINVGLGRVPLSAPVLILNPDLVVETGALLELMRVLENPGVGVAVPTIQDADGRLFPSLRREPTVTRMLGDALLGSRWWRARPGWLTETVHAHGTYRERVDVEWATGAALLVSPACRAAVGEWDEQFFLYSEETDFFRRVRDHGFRAVHVPEAVVVHEGGGSGTSPRLMALSSLNRVRYYSKWHSQGATVAYSAALALNELLRINQPGHREGLYCLLSRRRRSRLPGRALAEARE